METLMLIFWIVVGAGAIGLILWLTKSKKKKPVEKEIFSAPLDIKEPKVEPTMPKDDEEEAEEMEEQEDKEE